MGADVLTKVNMWRADVIVGKTILFDNFDGEKIEISTEEGIQDGHEKRIKGQGLPLLIEPGKRGDLVVTIHIQFPKQLTPERVKGIEEKLPDDPAIYE
jgi:DnaJ-class molecular chaperone